MAILSLGQVRIDRMLDDKHLRARDVMAWVAVVALWAILWGLARVAGENPDKSLWYLPAALTFSLLIAGGWRALALAIAGPLAHISAQNIYHIDFAAPFNLIGSVMAYVIPPFAHVLGYAIAAYGLRHMVTSKNAVEKTYELTPSYAIGLIAFALLGSGISAALGAAHAIHQGASDWTAWLPLYLNWWSGDFIGTVTLTPLLLLAFTIYPFPPLQASQHPFKLNAGMAPQFGVDYWATLLGTLAFICLLLWMKLNFQVPIPYSLPFLIGIAGFAFIALNCEITEVAVMIAVLGLVGAVGVKKMGSFELVVELDFFIPACILISLLSHTMRNLLIRNKTLASESLLDPLTGVFNRRGLSFNYMVHLRGIQGGRRRLCMAALDLDHFKRINDSLGHAVGDEVLQSVVAVLQRHTTANDCIARIGGDEIVLLLPGLSLDECLLKMDTIRQEISDIADFPLPVTASFGVIQVEADSSQEVALARADALLYQAKKCGRNRVES